MIAKAVTVPVQLVSIAVEGEKRGAPSFGGEFFKQAGVRIESGAGQAANPTPSGGISSSSASARVLPATAA
jgi:hypothetical protein